MSAVLEKAPASSELLVTIAIVTRNRQEVLRDSLPLTLDEVEKVPFTCEVLIVDSSSQDSLRELHDEKHGFRYHYLGDIAYSMVLGRNTVLRLAHGKIIVLIDDDCYVHPGWLESLITVFRDESVGAAGGRIIYHPWHKPMVGPNPAINLNLEEDLIQAHFDHITTEPVEVSHLAGGNLAFRRDLAYEVGGFDPNYIGSANLEETDFLYRIGHLGKRILFVPGATVEHRAAPRADKITRSHTNFVYRFSAVRNRLYMLRKYKAHRGLRKNLFKQLRDATLGTARLSIGALVFLAASLAGIFAGLTTSIESNRDRLEQVRKD